MPKNALTLHLDPDRSAFFARHRKDPAYYDSSMRCWIVLDPTEILRLLRHPGLVCEEIVPAIDGVAERYGESFDNLRHAASVMPLLMDGDGHRRIRREMAEFLNERRALMIERIPGLLESRFDGLRYEPEVDLVGDLFLPFVCDLFTELVGCRVAVPFERIAITRIFDRYLSLRTMRMIDREIATLREVILRDCSWASTDETRDLLLGILVIGRDSLIATLSESIGSSMAANLETSIADIAFGDFPSETGVAIAERRAVEPVAVPGAEIKPGDKVRLYLHGLNYSDRTAEQRQIFGAGAHSCLGRQLSLDVWKALIPMLRTVRQTVKDVDHGYLANHIFVMPDHVRVRLVP